MNVNHLHASHDAALVVRAGQALPSTDIDRAARMFMAYQVKYMLNSPSSSVIAIEGHSSDSQIDGNGSLSYQCAMLSQALRQLPQFNVVGTSIAPSSNIVLEFYSALHMADDDDLKGPQGLMRCLTTQLILSLVANEYISPTDAIYLPHLSKDREGELLVRQDLNAVCRIFAALALLALGNTAIYYLIDDRSAHERGNSELRPAGYDITLSTFHDISVSADTSNLDDVAGFKLPLTGPVPCQWLSDFFSPEEMAARHDGESAFRGLVWRR